METIVKVDNLSKSFGDIRAVDDLSFRVGSRQVYGFLGQNGAGKSTTIRMLLTLIEPDAGEIEIFNLSLRKHRNEILRQIGAIIEKPDLYKYLTALENISIFSKLSGVKVSRAKMMDQLAMVSLADRAASKVKTYSQGMKQRLGLACALIHDPQLIILDEPTNGLDPQGIAEMRSLIIHLSKNLNKTLLVSSHLLGEMEMVADSMLIINRGKKIVEGKVRELLNPSQAVVELETPDKEKALQFIQQSEWLPGLKDIVAGKIRLEIDKETIPKLNRQLVQYDIPVQSLRSIHSLEEYFLSLTKE
jgi:ABC-type multidrug transport system ATPase subunit